MPAPEALSDNRLWRFLRKALPGVGASAYSVLSSALKRSFRICSGRVLAVSCSPARHHRFGERRSLSAAQNLECAVSLKVWLESCGLKAFMLRILLSMV